MTNARRPPFSKAVGVNFQTARSGPSYTGLGDRRCSVVTACCHASSPWSDVFHFPSSDLSGDVGVLAVHPQPPAPAGQSRVRSSVDREREPQPLPCHEMERRVRRRAGPTGQEHHESAPPCADLRRPRRVGEAVFGARVLWHVTFSRQRPAASGQAALTPAPLAGTRHTSCPQHTPPRATPKHRALFPLWRAAGRRWQGASWVMDDPAYTVFQTTSASFSPQVGSEM